MPQKKNTQNESGQKNSIWGRSVKDEAELKRKQEVGNKIRSLREHRGETQIDFGYQFAIFLNREKPYTATTVAGWEKGILPDTKTRRKLCEFLNIEYSVLDCDVNGIYTHLDLEEISSLYQQFVNLANQPVWCEFNEETHEGAWAIVDTINNCFVFSYTKQVPFENIDFNIFKHPPAYIHAAESLLEPLSKEDIYDKVYIEPLKIGYENRHNAMEWATNYDIIDSYISESGQIYPHEDNGKTYLCYRDIK